MSFVEQAFVLDSLILNNENKYYANQTPKYKGELQFRGKSGEIKLKLNNDLSDKILALVAANMIEATTDLARSMTANIVVGLQAIPSLSLPTPAPEMKPLKDEEFLDSIVGVDPITDDISASTETLDDDIPF